MKNLFLKVVLMILTLTMLVSIGITVSAMEYRDDGYWANEAIDAAITNGLLQGKENGNIDSEANLTRAEMAAIMVRAFGASVKADVSQYVDIDPSAWYYDEFSKAVQMRVFEGDGTGYMHPNDNITREEVFTVVARAMVLSDTNHSVLNKFGDANQISSWARDYMSILTQKSYVNGDNLGNVNPKAYITRAEFAQLMYNIYKTYYLKTGSYSDTVDTACVMINTESVNLTNVVVKGDLIIGDGANLSTIKLTNVTIEGRLLVRGAARIELKKTTVGEMVVVNNYNSVVHFDNYRYEKVFDGIIENTKATFKQRSGGGGTVTSPYVTVTFIDNGSVVGTVELAPGNSMADENESFPNVSWSENGYVKDTNISPIYTGDKAYTHTVNWGWWYNPTTLNNPTTLQWEEFTKDTKVNDNIEVSLRVKKFATWVYADIKPDGFPFAAYYETDTRFVDTLKDILYSDSPLEALKKSGYWDTVKEKLANYKLIDSIDLNDNIEMQNIMIKFSQVLGGEKQTREFIIETAKETFGKNTELTDAFTEYVVKVIESSDPSKVIELLEKAIIHEIDYDANSLPTIKEMLKKVLADENAFKAVYESIIGQYPGSLTDAQKEIVIEETCNLLETNSVDRTKVVDIAVEYLITPAHRSELEYLIEYSMTYLNNHPEERNLMVEDIIDEIYSAELDTLVDELVNKDQFTVTSKISFVAEGLKDKLLTDYSYDSFIAAQIPEKLKKVFEIYPESKVKDIYGKAVGKVTDQVDAALAAINADPAAIAKIDSGLTAVFNPVTDVYKPLYEGVLNFIEDKTNGYYFYYDENEYLQEFIKLLSPDSLFEYVGNQSETLSGYKLRTLEEYYDLVEALVFLGDDAILWYYEDENVRDEVERVTDSYQKLILKYVNVVADILDRYAKDGTLPNQKLSPIEQAIKNKYPKLVNDIVAWYKDSDINKDYNNEDFQKVQDKVRKAFEYVNITTDEFFDLILNNKRLEDIDKLDKYFEKLGDDKYKLEAKGNIMEFLRELVYA